MSEDDVDIRFIGRQLKSINDRLGSMEDQMTVLTAIVMRLDSTVGGLSTELRAIHSQQNRMLTRIKALESAATDEASP